MITVLLSLVAIFLILVLSEVLWNDKKLKGELARKFVHISVGTFVAFWPFYMSFHTIQLISVAFLLVTLASRYLKVFSAVHTVDRKTWGDVLFAVGIGATAIFTKSDWIFMAAILNMSLADGLAGIIGKRFGKSNNYKILGHAKSIAGSLTFLIVSLLVLIAANNFGHLNIDLGTIFGLAIAAMVVENFGIYGLDNVFVPILITLVLGQL
jgi:phytol kinase